MIDASCSVAVRATGVFVALLCAGTVVAQGPQARATLDSWDFYVEPLEGRGFVATAKDISDTGFTPVAAKSGLGTTIPWTSIRTVFVEPPVQWDEVKHNTLVIDDDGRDRVTSNFGKIKLRKGFHRFELIYAHTAATGKDDCTLQLDFKAPGTSSWSEVPAEMLKKQVGWRWPEETISSGFDEEGFRLPDQPTDPQPGIKLRKLSWHGFGVTPSRVPDIKHIPLVSYSLAKMIQPISIDLDGRDVPEIAGVFAGLLDIPKDGEYRFRLKSDGIAAFFVGFRGPRIQERVFPYKPTDWVASLAYGGKLVAPEMTFQENVLTLDLPHGPSKNNPNILSVPVPRQAVRLLTRKSVDALELPEVSNVDADHDVLFATGSSGAVRGISGRVVSVADGQLTFELAGDERTVELERVQAIRFAETELTSGQPPPAPVLMVNLFGEQVLPARIVSNSGNWDFHFAAIGYESDEALTKESPEAFRIYGEALRGFRVYGGGAFTLRDLEPLVTQVPLFELSPVYAVDQSPTGEPLKIGREVFESGFAVGPKTTLDFNLGRAFKTLRTTVGIQAGTGNSGAAAVRILGDGELVYETDSLTVDDGALEISADVKDREQLRVVVDFGPRFDVGDVVVIADSELLRQQPEQEGEPGSSGPSSGAASSD